LNILVTGAAGYIGSICAEGLLARGSRRGVVALQQGNICNELGGEADAPLVAEPSEEGKQRLARDLCADPFYRLLDRTEVLLQIGLGFALYAFGGWPTVVWGIFVRLVLLYHSTWLVNSASHMFGYRSYKTDDLSRNNWWVAIISWGEGWHNNHHAFQFSARHGLRWFEFDPVWLVIKALAIVKLAREIKVPTVEMRERLKVVRKLEIVQN